MDDFTPAEEIVLDEVQKEFEEFYQKSPFARPDRLMFDKDNIYTAMYGSYIAGMASGISLVKKTLDTDK